MVSTPSIYGILLEGTWKRSVKGYDSFFDEIIFGMIHLYSLQKYLSTLTNNEVSLCKISWMMFHSRPSTQAKHCSWEARRGLGVSMGVKSVMENRRFFIHFFFAISNLCLAFLLLHDCLDPRFNTLSFQPANVSGLIVIFKFFRKGGPEI